MFTKFGVKAPSGERARARYSAAVMVVALGAMDAAAEEAVTRLSDLRARCLAELHYDGWSYAKIAEAVGISRARVQQLVERGSDVTP